MVPKTDSNTRIVVLEQTLTLINKSKSIELARQWESRLKQFIQWFKDWKLTKQQTKNIYLVASKICKRAQNKSLEQEYLLNYLQTWEDDAKIPETAMEQANRGTFSFFFIFLCLVYNCNNKFCFLFIFCCFFLYCIVL